MSFAASTLLLPAPDAAWRVWKPRMATAGETITRPADVSAHTKPLVIGLPASACLSIGMVLPNADHDVLEQMIMTHLERRGLKMHGGAERNFRWHLITQNASTATVSVDVLAEPFPEDLAVTHAADYTAALRLVSLPVNQLVIIEEQGSLVLAAGFQGKLYHSHIFAPTTAGSADIAQEIMLARLTLEQELGGGSLSGITLVGTSWERDTLEQLEGLAGLPVKSLSQLPPNTELDTRSWTRLLPAIVREAQVSQTRRRMIVRFGTLGALLYLALGFLAFSYLQYLQKQASLLSQQVESTAAPAEAVRKTAQRWKMLSPALEPKRYPLVLLSEITRLMPPSGIVIREFEVKGNEIEIRGDARDAQVAFQFIEDLKKNSALGRYVWTMPQPTVKEKTASFRAQGKEQ